MNPPPIFRPDPSLRSDFADDGHWRDLARASGYILPRWGIAPTPEKMRRWLRRLQISPSDYLREKGYAELADFHLINPGWPLRAWVGQLLEFVQQRDKAIQVSRAYRRN